VSKDRYVFVCSQGIGNIARKGRTLSSPNTYLQQSYASVKVTITF